MSLQIEGYLDLLEIIQVHVLVLHDPVVPKKVLASDKPIGWDLFEWDIAVTQHVLLLGGHLEIEEVLAISEVDQRVAFNKLALNKLARDVNLLHGLRVEL